MGHHRSLKNLCPEDERAGWVTTEVCPTPEAIIA